MRKLRLSMPVIFILGLTIFSYQNCAVKHMLDDNLAGSESSSSTLGYGGPITDLNMEGDQVDLTTIEPIKYQYGVVTVSQSQPAISPNSQPSGSTYNPNSTGNYPSATPNNGTQTGTNTGSGYTTSPTPQNLDLSKEGTYNTTGGAPYPSTANGQPQYLTETDRSDESQLTAGAPGDQGSSTSRPVSSSNNNINPSGSSSDSAPMDLTMAATSHMETPSQTSCNSPTSSGQGAQTNQMSPVPKKGSTNNLSYRFKTTNGATTGGSPTPKNKCVSTTQQSLTLSVHCTDSNSCENIQLKKSLVIGKLPPGTVSIFVQVEDDTCDKVEPVTYMLPTSQVQGNIKFNQIPLQPGDPYEVLLTNVILQSANGDSITIHKATLTGTTIDPVDSCAN